MLTIILILYVWLYKYDTVADCIYCSVLSVSYIGYRIWLSISRRGKDSSCASCSGCPLAQYKKCGNKTHYSGKKVGGKKELKHKNKEY